MSSSPADAIPGLDRLLDPMGSVPAPPVRNPVAAAARATQVAAPELPPLPRATRRRRIWMRAVMLVALATLLMATVAYKLVGDDESGEKRCEMTYMVPNYLAVNMTTRSRWGDRYGLVQYREGRSPQAQPSYNGVPILFIHGNAGSAAQVRSLAATAARTFSHVPLGRYTDPDRPDLELVDGQERLSRLRPVNELHWWAVDFGEELSALHGELLWRQGEFVNDCLRMLLSRYQEVHTKAHLPGSPPTSVIVVAHSMGGVVARLLPLLPNHPAGSVSTIITLATPHRPPVLVSPSSVQVYTAMNRMWRENATQAPFKDMAVVSVSGGFQDDQVRGDLASLEGLLPSHLGWTQWTTGMGGVHLSTDHLNILWCNQLVRRLVSTLFTLVDPTSLQVVESQETRFASLKRGLASPRGLPPSPPHLWTDRPELPISSQVEASDQALVAGLLANSSQVRVFSPARMQERPVVRREFLSPVWRFPIRSGTTDFTLATSLVPGKHVRVFLCTQSLCERNAMDEVRAHAQRSAYELTEFMAAIPTTGPLLRPPRTGGEPAATPAGPPHRTWTLRVEGVQLRGKDCVVVVFNDTVTAPESFQNCGDSFLSASFTPSTLARPRAGSGLSLPIPHAPVTRLDFAPGMERFLPVRVRVRPDPEVNPPDSGCQHTVAAAYQYSDVLPEQVAHPAASLHDLVVQFHGGAVLPPTAGGLLNSSLHLLVVSDPRCHYTLELEAAWGEALEVAARSLAPTTLPPLMLALTLVVLGRQDVRFKWGVPGDPRPGPHYPSFPAVLLNTHTVTGGGVEGRREFLLVHGVAYLATMVTWVGSFTQSALQPDLVSHASWPAPSVVALVIHSVLLQVCATAALLVVWGVMWLTSFALSHVSPLRGRGLPAVGRAGGLLVISIVGSQLHTSLAHLVILVAFVVASASTHFMHRVGPSSTTLTRWDAASLHRYRLSWLVFHLVAAAPLFALVPVWAGGLRHSLQLADPFNPLVLLLALPLMARSWFLSQQRVFPGGGSVYPLALAAVGGLVVFGGFGNQSVVVWVAELWALVASVVDVFNLWPPAEGVKRGKHDPAEAKKYL